MKASLCAVVDAKMSELSGRSMPSTSRMNEDPEVKTPGGNDSSPTTLVTPSVAISGRNYTQPCLDTEEPGAMGGAFNPILNPTTPPHHEVNQPGGGIMPNFSTSSKLGGYPNSDTDSMERKQKYFPIFQSKKKQKGVIKNLDPPPTQTRGH